MWSSPTSVLSATHIERVVHCEIQHPEVGFERRERVVRHFGVGGGDRREQRGFARVRQAHEPDIRDEPQLQPKFALFAGLTLLSVPRRLLVVEDLAKGQKKDEAVAKLAGMAATRGAKPLNFNHFKVPLTQNLVTRAIRDS